MIIDLLKKNILVVVILVAVCFIAFALLSDKNVTKDNNGGKEFSFGDVQFFLPDEWSQTHDTELLNFSNVPIGNIQVYETNDFSFPDQEEIITYVESGMQLIAKKESTDFAGELTCPPNDVYNTCVEITTSNEVQGRLLTNLNFDSKKEFQMIHNGSFYTFEFSYTLNEKSEKTIESILDLIELRN